MISSGTYPHGRSIIIPRSHDQMVEAGGLFPKSFNLCLRSRERINDVMNYLYCEVEHYQDGRYAVAPRVGSRIARVAVQRLPVGPNLLGEPLLTKIQDDDDKSPRSFNIGYDTFTRIGEIKAYLGRNGIYRSCVNDSRIMRVAISRLSIDPALFEEPLLCHLNPEH